MEKVSSMKNKVRFFNYKRRQNKLNTAQVLKQTVPKWKYILNKNSEWDEVNTYGAELLSYIKVKKADIYSIKKEIVCSTALGNTTTLKHEYWKPPPPSM